MAPNSFQRKPHRGLRRIVWLLSLVVGGLAFFWLVVLRIAAKLAGGGPCPFALAWIVDNPLRRRYMAPLLDRVGIEPGERVLELGPGPGTFSVEAARRAGAGGIRCRVRPSAGPQKRAFNSLSGTATGLSIPSTSGGRPDGVRLCCKIEDPCHGQVAADLC
jgi:hypothetical protein